MRSLFLALVIFVSGCTNMSGSSAGGTGDFNTTKMVETVLPDGNTLTETTNRNVNVNQPQNAKEPATIKYTEEPSGKISILVGTGNSFNVSGLVAGIHSMKPVMWAGIAMVLGGVAIIGFSKLTQLLLGSIIGLGGIATISLAYLLPQNPIVFMIGLAALIIAGFWYIITTSLKYANREKALQENVKLVQDIKDDYLTPEEIEEIFKARSGLANNLQSPATKKLVGHAKETLRKNGKL